MINIVIKSDYFAYITVDEDSKRYFDLIKKSFTREVRQYNNFYKYWETVVKLHFTLVNSCTTIKVKAGLIPFLCNSFDRRKIKYNLIDERKNIDRKLDIQVQLNDEVSLTGKYSYQKDAVEQALKNRFCFIELPTGTGKTEVAASIIKTFLIAYPEEAVLYTVPTVALREQSTKRFENYGIEVNTKFPIQVGKANILCYKSLMSADTEKYDYHQRDSIGAFIVDEAHHLSAPKISKQVHRLHNLRLCIGVSATPSDNLEDKEILRDLSEKEMNVFGSTGKIVYNMKVSESVEQNFTTGIELRVLTNSSRHILADDENDWQVIKDVILKDIERAKRVAEYTKHIVNEANLNNVVLLIPEVEWSHIYMDEVYKLFKEDKNVRIFEMYGQGKILEHTPEGSKYLTQAEKEKLKQEDIPNPNIKTIYSATSFFREGVDIPSIQALINVGGGKGVIPTKQIVGRIMRLFKGKDIAYLHEIKDINNPVLINQFDKRISIYEKDYKAKIIYSKF